MCHNLRVGGRRPPVTLLTTPGIAALTAGKARHRFRIVISAYPTCIRRPHLGGSHQSIAIPFGVEKLEWCGYPMVKKMEDILFVLIQSNQIKSKSEFI